MHAQINNQVEFEESTDYKWQWSFCGSSQLDTQGPVPYASTKSKFLSDVTQ